MLNLGSQDWLIERAIFGLDEPGVRYEGLIDPYIQIQISMIIVDAGVGVRHDDGRRSRSGIPRRGALMPKVPFMSHCVPF